MSTTYTRWYRTGSVALTKGSTDVIGTGTYWSTAGLNAGDLLTIDNGQSFLEVASITDDTHLTLANAYTGDTATGAGYAIVRNFTAGTLPKYAAAAAELIGDFKKYVDTDLKQITGKSAYEIAQEQGFSGSKNDWLDTLNAYGVAKKNGFVGTVNQWLESLTAYGRAKDNGFSGTEAEWLESLIGANEWATLNERTKLFINDGVGKRVIANNQTYGPLHNSIARGKCLGDHITDEQWAAIKNGTFDDMYIGDWWDFNFGSKINHLCARYYIMAFNPCIGSSSRADGVSEDQDGEIFYSQNVSNLNAVNKNDIEPVTDAMLGAPEDNSHCGGHIMLWCQWDFDIPEALVESGTNYNSLQRLVKLNPAANWQDAPDPAVNYSSPGRTDPTSAFNKKKEFFKTFFGENHLAYVPINVASAWNEETNSPSALKTIREFYDFMPISFMYGYFPGEIAEKYKNSSGVLYNRKMPLWDLAGQNYCWSGWCQEQADIRNFYHIASGTVSKHNNSGQTFISLR